MSGARLTASREVLAIRQVRFKDLGALAPVLESLGYRIRYLDATRDDLTAANASDPDLVVILGGPPCATDEARFPFLVDQLRLIEQRLNSGRPMLGICLGAQLIARALGGRIHPDVAPELGWWPVHLSTAGHASSLRYLSQVPVLHWHSDAIELPAQAERLAWTENCEVQAFAHGEAVLGLQFHPEVDADAMQEWLAAHVSQLDAHPLQSVERLRDETLRCSQWMTERSAAMLRDWINGLDAGYLAG